MSPDEKKAQERLEECISSFVMSSRVPVFLGNSVESESEAYFIGYWLHANLCRDQHPDPRSAISQRQSKTQLRLSPDRVWQATKVLTNILADEDTFQDISIKVFMSLYNVELKRLGNSSKDQSPLEIFMEIKKQVVSQLIPLKIPTNLNDELVGILQLLIEKLDHNSNTVMLQAVDWIMGLFRLPDQKLRLEKIQDDLTLKKSGKFFSLHSEPNTYQENFLGVMNYLLQVNKQNRADMLFTGKTVNMSYICERLYTSYIARFPLEDRLNLSRPFRGIVVCEEAQQA